jgi:hypothetical protein
MTRLKLIAVATVAALMAIATPAQAQMDAGDRPSTSGPLTTRDRFHDCRSRVERFQGEVAGRFRICYWYFLYNPARESHGRRNYAGFWAQATINPVGPWCLRRAHLDLELPRLRHVHSRAPRPGTVLRPRSARRYRPRLEVDAQGYGDRSGFIANTFVVFPNRLAVTRPDRRTHRMTWSGGTGRTVAFASGVELSYRPGRMLPQVDPRVFASLARTGTC